MIRLIFSTTGIGILLFGLLGGCQSSSGGGRFLLSSKIREEWTVLCREFSGPAHRQHCLAFADSLRRTPGIKASKVRCEHDNLEQASRLFYGSYYREVDPKTNRLSTPQELRSDIALIQDLGDESGQRYFFYAKKVPIVKKSTGPREWDLRHARGVYTLQIAVFFPERNFTEVQKAAIEYTRSLRKEGLEAYYYHGPIKSIVTVGAFDDSAVIEHRGVRKYSQEILALQQREECKFNYENGQKRVKIVRGEKKEPFSFLVKIPRTDGDIYGSPWKD